MVSDALLRSPFHDGEHPVLSDDVRNWEANDGGVEKGGDRDCGREIAVPPLNPSVARARCKVAKVRSCQGDPEIVQPFCMSALILEKGHCDLIVEAVRVRG
jgi:hypothetical protein